MVMANSKLRMKSLIMGPVQTNVYFLFLEGNETESGYTPCIVVDPADNGKYIYDYLNENKLCAKLILLTHAHFDHIGGADELKDLTKAPIYCYEHEKEMCTNAESNLSAFHNNPVTVSVSKFLKDGDEIESAGIKLKLLATPGHTMGSCCYYIEDENVLISGDTLFEGSVGRTDFPGGSMSSLLRSISEKIVILPDETLVLPGHGSSTTILDEKMYNPYFNMV